VSGHLGADLGSIAVALVALGSLSYVAVMSVRRMGKPGTGVPMQASSDSNLRVVQLGGQPAVSAHRAGAPRAGSAQTVSRPARRQAGRRVATDAEILPADATVTFAEERELAQIDEILEALDRDLVGLVPIKQKVQEIASLLLVDRARRRFGLIAPRPNLHMCFTGPPGTGKTTMALRMAELLQRLGYLETGQLVHAMRDDLVGEFIGQTAPKTRRVLDRAMGGVLFIDEAYYLFRASDSKDYGQESIEILLQVMENERQNLVVVLAGYKDRMDEFFSSNPGMGSRIAHHLDFAPYDIGELVSIGGLFLNESHYYLSPEAESAFREYIAGQIDEPSFAYARTVRNDLDRARLRQAHRIAGDGQRPWTRDDLMRLEAEDILERADQLLLRSDLR
jgi:probable Rubsico expression protein CbbX